MDTSCDFRARGRIAAGLWGDVGKSNLAIISIFYFFFPFALFPPSLNIFPFSASQNNTMSTDIFSSPKCHTAAEIPQLTVTGHYCRWAQEVDAS